MKAKKHIYALFLCVSVLLSLCLMGSVTVAAKEPPFNDITLDWTCSEHEFSNDEDIVCDVCGYVREFAAIVTDIQHVYAKMGEPARATVEATGDGITYAWYFLNVGDTAFSKSSITGATYSVTMSESVKGRLVYCVVTDEYGKTARSASVYLREHVAVTTQPTTGYAAMGKKVSVSVAAIGDGLRYEWWIKNEGQSKYSKSSITTSTYTTTMSDSSKNRRVLCKVYDKFGNMDQSKSVLLRESVSITSQSTAGYAPKGESVSVKVNASGDGLTYVWRIKNEGASKYSSSSVTSATYSVKMSDSSKNRRVFCYVYDKYGNRVQSETMILREAVSITSQSTAGYAPMGQKVSVKVNASGDGLRYVWRIKNEGGSKYSSSSVTGSTYTTTMSASSKNRRVFCYVYDKYGNRVQSVTMILRETVSVVTQPKTTTVASGSTAKVSVGASGDGLTYTWYIKNEGQTKYSVSSVTKSSYSTTMNTKSKNRMLYCVVKDKYGNVVTTETVTLKMK